MIQAEGLYFSYTNAPPYVLSDLRLRVHDGAYISVVGDNGSGKTTLMRLILRLLKPTAGTIRSTARRIGYIPQKQDAPNAGFPITVREMLNAYRHLLRLKDRHIVEKSLRTVGMDGFDHALMGTLSGGQTQKILIARALMGDPDLLILDEPSAGVDNTSQTEIYALLRRLNQDLGITILSVEHNLDAAVTNSTLIYHLVDGNGHLCQPQQYADEFLFRHERGR